MTFFVFKFLINHLCSYKKQKNKDFWSCFTCLHFFKSISGYGCQKKVTLTGSGCIMQTQLPMIQSNIRLPLNTSSKHIKAAADFPFQDGTSALFAAALTAKLHNLDSAHRQLPDQSPGSPAASRSRVVRIAWISRLFIKRIRFL